MIVTLLLFCYISVYEIFVFIFGNMKKGFLLEWTTFIYNKCHISEHTISGLCFHWLCCRFPLLRFRIPYLIYSCALKGHCLFTISILIEMHCSKIEPTQMKGREGKGEEKCSTSFKLRPKVGNLHNINNSHKPCCNHLLGSVETLSG